MVDPRATDRPGTPGPRLGPIVRDLFRYFLDKAVHESLVVEPAAQQVRLKEQEERCEGLPRPLRRRYHEEGVVRSLVRRLTTVPAGGPVSANDRTSTVHMAAERTLR